MPTTEQLIKALVEKDESAKEIVESILKEKILAKIEGMKADVMQRILTKE
jgi:hypothetical protein